MDFSLKSYLEELELLVNVDCGTYTLDGIEVIASQFEQKYSAMKRWDVKRRDCGPAGVGLEVRNKPNSEYIDIMLIGHMDTVFAPGTVAKRPMSVDDHKAYGPGVSDMKSGLLNVVYALRHLDTKILDTLSICVCMNPDEETGSADSVEWIQSVAKHAKQVLVVEAARADGGLVKSRKGMARYKLMFHGQAAHAGNEPQNGCSAITEMAQWIIAMNKMTNFESGSTLNVGVVSGGSGANIVPDYAEAIVDVRFWSNDEYDAIDSQLNGLSHNPFLDGIHVALKREAYKPSMLASEATATLIKLVEQSAKELNIDISWKEVGGGSDANNTAILGVPTLDGLGPIGADFHSDKEYLLLESIEPRIRLLMRIIEKLAH
ncbi:M20 family metallopeptidase [Vibrio genomosp. F10 str. 9ZC157]|uniref:Peptidase M20 n=1 Tax=Vibrio genomosp. F10 str. ZF-129 TaxID=1187848 RepID=A0A1E5B9S7_9VIBR|nr:M20 family metallopeptidase [Vibrio genomosp. F10]OEE30662.1 peptidase M20 [Vibrio genomosp. F10 str. ZF-129]OEE94794.1 peptidase M20 [Vibrio genomosp. F10 str. 9ZC157]